MSTFELLHDIIRTRRSVRRWTDEAIPREDLVHMVDCARLAPSDTNAQPWHFTVVTDRRLIRELEAATRQRFADLSEELQASGRREVARKLRVFERYAAHFGSAPALVVVSGEPYDSRFMREVFAQLISPSEFEMMAHDESIKSTALASMNLLLAAHALGYGAVPMTGPVLVIPEVLRTKLRLPEGFDPHLLIAVGKPDANPSQAVSRKPLDEVVAWVD